MKQEALEVLRNRRAIRKYKPEQITEEELNAVLEAGLYAPTGGGKQGIRIVVIQKSEDIEAVNKLNAKIMNMPDMTPYYGAPTVILIFETDDCMTHELDGASVCANMLDAAYAVGLGSCWIHRCKPMFETEEGKELLKKWGITENVYGVASLALGYEDGPHPEAAPRKEGIIIRV